MNTSPLLDRLTGELGWPTLNDQASLDTYCAQPGEHCLFLPGDPKKNLETNDAAVIVPELVHAFQGRFDIALIGADIERSVRVANDVWQSPSLIFVRDGEILGAIKRIRNWDDYLQRIVRILDGTAVAAAE